MKSIMLLTCCLGIAGCAADERWEGTLQGCDNSGDSGTQVLLTVDQPSPPSPTGWAGQAGDNDKDTWVMTQLSQTSIGFGNFKYRAEFDFSVGAFHTTEDWHVDLQKDGLGKYKGDVEITRPSLFGGSNTVRCKIELSRKD